MSKTKDNYTQRFYSTDELSVQQYIDLIRIIQQYHAFGDMREGNKALKYIDSVMAVQDTRDSSVFTFRFAVRGFGTVGFFVAPKSMVVEGITIPPELKENSIITNKSMFDTVIEYLGYVEPTMTVHDLGILRGMKIEFGSWAGRRGVCTDEMRSKAKDLGYNVSSTSFHVGSITQDTSNISGRFFFEEGTCKLTILCSQGIDVLFTGVIRTQDDFLRVLHLVGIKTSY